MATDEFAGLRAETATALERMQTFDPSTLVRERDLGAELNFAPAVAPARQLVELYQRLSVSALQDFPQQQLEHLKNQAQSDFAILNSILEFKASQNNPHNVRQGLIERVKSAYQPTFTTLHPLVAYSLHRSADFQQLDRDARAALQNIRDQADKIVEELESTSENAKTVLDEARKVAAEAGVSQQATHFRKAAEDHESLAVTWETRTINFAIALGIFAFLSFFLHKIPWIAPENTYDTVQLAVSKILVFATLSYMLYLAARNFLSHKHNAIVNRHRQDALLTYRALVEAAGVAANRDVVLTYAAACIFGPQSTGYTGDCAQNGAPRSVVELLTKQFSED